MMASMNRLGFLKTLLVGAVATAIPGLRKPSPAWVLNRCLIAGFRYHEGPRVRDRLRVGDPVLVRSEFDNPHDRNAIALWHDGAMLGYVPRAENRPLARLIRQGAPLRARILGLSPDDDPRLAVRVEISLVAG